MSPRRARRLEGVLLALGIALCPPPALAAEPSVRVDIGAGTLADALIALGEQTGTSIGIADRRARRVRSAGLRGEYSLSEALSRLLEGSGYGFILVDRATVSIVPLPRAPKRGVRGTPPPAVQDSGEILVTASKTGTPLDRYAGGVDIVDLRGAGKHGGSGGSGLITDLLPVIASTSLGPGRNKLFVRGIADSSFNGPTQATVGQYLGDVRLTYNAPDPDLSLYDVQRIELLEGPQGTLYGTGALGGILRLVPAPVDLAAVEGSMAGGWITTRHGANGGDLAAMLNMPLAIGRAGLRLVGYGVRDPGYIDDIGRGRKDINRTISYGGRATLRIAPGDGWTIDVGGVLQNIGGRDGQYSERGLPPLTRSSALAQPFDNDYLLGQMVVRKQWDSMELVSASAIVDHEVDTHFDATGADGTSGPALFIERNAILLVSHETRLSGDVGARGAWVAGVSALRDVQRIRRRLGDPSDPPSIAGVRNDVTEAALFGQAELPMGRRWTATLGGRVTYATADGKPLDLHIPEDAEPRRKEVHVSPTLALAWQPAPRWTLFLHYQGGYRAGGLAVSQSGADDAVQRFKPDELASIEAGVRFGNRTRGRLWGSATGSFARWKNIQADLVDDAGLPFTTNIGRGRIWAFEAQLGWAPVEGLVLDGRLFINDSKLYDPDAPFVLDKRPDLPNIADAGGRISAAWLGKISDRASLRLDMAVRYVGRSLLAVAEPLDIRQGGFAEASAGARLDLGGYGVSLDISNLADSRGNRFSYGNPFSVGEGRQTSPLRPRSVRLGIDAHF